MVHYIFLMIGVEVKQIRPQSTVINGGVAHVSVQVSMYVVGKSRREIPTDI
jgi:hypothetical protein